MPLLLPGRNKLIYPAGAPAGIDPSHPAAQNLVLSAIATGANFIDLLRGVNADSVSVAGASIDGALGAVTKYTASVSWATFSTSPVPARSATTLAGIFRSTSASDAQTLVGFGSFDSLLFYTTDGNSIGWYDGSQHNVSLNVATNQPYFLAASANTAGVNFILKNLATGQIQTAVFTGVISLPITNTSITMGGDTVSGGSDSMGGFMAAAMMNLNFLSMPQMLQWAEDPWAFWYPPTPRKVSYFYGPTPDTTTTNGVRLRQRWNRPSLAYPSGAVAGFDPSHPAARALRFSGVADNKNIVSLTQGCNGTILGTTSNFAMDGNLGQVFTVGNVVNDASIFSGQSATNDGNATFAAIVRINTVSNNTQTIMSNSSGNNGWELHTGSGAAPTLCVSGKAVDTCNSGLAILAGAPYFVVASTSSAVFQFVVLRIDTGQVFFSTITKSISPLAPNGTYTVGDNGFGENLNGRIAAVMFAASYMSLAEMFTWSSDPWAFWYPRQTQRLIVPTATPIVTATQYAAFCTPQRDGAVYTQMTGY